eukprot:TRINITY_DN22896_c0_g1_i1.p1 TRINITY_DN22896_c0_g1~~TRINITY_DN22896_c0_g1_i1.p1  ORF type:complete len:1216 (-),score=295.56 TRINITY_DN22896_c0_g1_i1:212-3859(-)
MSLMASPEIIKARRQSRVAAAVQQLGPNYNPRDCDERTTLEQAYNKHDSKQGHLRFMYNSARSSYEKFQEEDDESLPVAPIGRLFKAAEAFRKSARELNFARNTCDEVVRVHDERLKWLKALREADRKDEMEAMKHHRLAVVKKMANVLTVITAQKAEREKTKDTPPKTASTLGVVSTVTDVVAKLKTLYANLQAANAAQQEVSSTMGNAAAEAARLVAMLNGQVKHARSDLVTVADATLNNIEQAGKLVEEAAEQALPDVPEEEAAENIEEATKLPDAGLQPPLHTKERSLRKLSRKLTHVMAAARRCVGEHDEDVTPRSKALVNAIKSEDDYWKCGAIVSALDDTLVACVQDVTSIVRDVSKELNLAGQQDSHQEWKGLETMCNATLDESSQEVMALTAGDNRKELRQRLLYLAMVKSRTTKKMVSLVRQTSPAEGLSHAPAIEAIIRETPAPVIGKPSPEWMARKLLRKFLMEQWGGIPEAFAALDTRNSGQVNFHDFQRILWERGYVFNFLSAWYVVSGDEGDSAVSARQFMMSLGVDPGLPDDQLADASRDVIDLRRFLLGRFGSLRRGFEFMDTRQKGRLSEEDFADGIRKMNYSPGPPMTVWQMLCRASEIGGAEVGWETFVTALNANRRSASKIAEMTPKLRRMSKAPDDDKTIQLSYDDVMDGLWRLGYLNRSFSPTQSGRRPRKPLLHMSDRIWKERDQFLSVAEFLVQACGTASEAFDHLDIAKTGSINAREFSWGLQRLMYNQPHTAAWKNMTKTSKCTVSKSVFVQRMEVCPLVATFWESLRSKKSHLQDVFGEAINQSPTKTINFDGFSKILALHGCAASAQTIWLALSKNADMTMEISMDRVATGLRTFLPRSERILDLALFILARCGRIDTAFAYMDEKKAGTMTDADMASALYRFGYAGSQVDTGALLREICVADGGMVTQPQFERALYAALASLEADKEKLEARRERDHTAALSVLLTELADFFRRRCGTLENAFEAMDVDNANWLESQEFRTGMKRLRYAGNWQVAWRAIVGEGRRRVTKQQFLDCFRESAQESQAVSDLVDFLCSSCGTLQRAFLTLDQTATGYIDALKLEVGLRDLGYEGDIQGAWREILGPNGLGLVLHERKRVAASDNELEVPTRASSKKLEDSKPPEGWHKVPPTPRKNDVAAAPVSLPKIDMTSPTASPRKRNFLRDKFMDRLDPSGTLPQVRFTARRFV